jgi:tellurite resistance protein
MVAASALLFIVASTMAQVDPPAPKSVRQLVLELIGQAQQIKKTPSNLPESPDLAERKPVPLDTTKLQRALSQRAHRDPFIDAYVRWQLTSLVPGLPEMDQAGFLTLLSQLPPMVENPRADPVMVTLLERAEARGPMPQRDLDRLRATVDQLNAATERARELNRPALGLRAWLERQANPDGLRYRLLLLETCAATVKAAWSTRDIKAQITRNLTDANHQAQLTPEERRRLAMFIQRLGGLEHQFINKITFMANGSVQVTLSTAAVTRNDAMRWIELLDTESPEAQVFPAPPQNAPTAISLPQAIRILKDEANAALESHRLPRSRADLAAAYESWPAWPKVFSRLVRPVHDEPFVDAYVRWQLTSFQPEDFSIPGESLGKLLADLPPLVQNPRANRKLLTQLNNTIAKGQLAAKTQDAWKQRLEELETQTQRARDMNLPGLRLRQWVIEHVQPRSAGPLLVELEQCAALARAGWSTDRVKSRLDETFAAMGRSRRFSDDDRRKVADAAQRSITPSRVYVQSTEFDEGLLIVRFAETGIYDFEVRQWLQALRRPDRSR